MSKVIRNYLSSKTDEASMKLLKDSAVLDLSEFFFFQAEDGIRDSP